MMERALHLHTLPISLKLLKTKLFLSLKEMLNLFGVTLDISCCCDTYPSTAINPVASDSAFVVLRHTCKSLSIDASDRRPSSSKFQERLNTGCKITTQMAFGVNAALQEFLLVNVSLSRLLHAMETVTEKACFYTTIVF